MLTEQPNTPYPMAMVTPAQVRAARAMLRWTQADLARKSGVSEIAIKQFELGKTDARGSTLAKLEAAFVVANILFLDPGESKDGGHGIRIKHPARMP